MLRLLWRMTRGYRLRPWRSPYLRWRLETYAGLPAETISFWRFWRFVWSEQRELLRYFRWAEGMRLRALKRENPAGPSGEFRRGHPGAKART
jgi:hypothetical protein